MRIRKTVKVPIDEEITLIAKVSDALSHPVRVVLFKYIMHCNQSFKSVCNKDLVAHFDYAQATISQHMNKLVQSGLVEIKKENKFTYYYAHLGLLRKYLDATKSYWVI